MRNSVIIATNAEFLAVTLREKLRDASFQVFIAATDGDLAVKIKAVFPRFVFLEHCFHGHGTDCFVQQIVRRNRKVRFAVWSVSEVKPKAAARFIMAGAESFFTLRDTEQNLKDILRGMAEGRHYCPADVEAVLGKDCAVPAIGGELTRQEVKIIKLSLAGKTNKQIAEMLSISVHTIKFHKSNIYRKCGGNTVVDILCNGLKRGILRPEDFEQ
jgi:DNA-binding NarL/FixJ family response regulator